MNVDGRDWREHRPILVVLGIGLLLRVAMMVALPAPLLNFSDANVYVRAAQDNLFIPGEGRTAGYPLLLRTLHAIIPSPVLPVVAQHLIALAAGTALYAIARTKGVGRWQACVPAAVWVCSLDWLWLEHQLLTEVLAAALIVAALAVALLPRADRPWVVPLVATLALSAGLVRPSMVSAIPGLALAVIVTSTRWRARTIRLAAFAAVVGVLFVGYVALQEHETGFRGLTGVGLIGMGSYPAAAPYADCNDFEVPPGTRVLCQTTVPDARPGADYYYWNPSSPGRRLLTAHPELEPAIRTWGQRARDAKPNAVWTQRSRTVTRLLGVGSFKRPLTDQGPEIFDFDQADTHRIPVAVEYVAAYYGAGSIDYDSAGAPWGALEALQPLTRPPGLLIFAALLVTLIGLLRGRDRGVTAAVALTGWLPPAFVIWIDADYNWRYFLVSLPIVALGAVLATRGAQVSVGAAWRRRRESWTSFRARTQSRPSG